MSDTFTVTLPRNRNREAMSILTRQYDLQPLSIDRVVDEVINTTFIVKDVTGNRFVLQRLHKIFSSATIYDTQAINDFLNRLGWEIRLIVSTNSEALYAMDDTQNIWRLLTYIEADDSSDDEYSSDTLMSIGALLAKFHNSLSDFDYTPVAGIPHFHDTAYYAKLLRIRTSRLPMTQHVFADQVYKAHTAIAKTHEPSQLIHGDPHPKNILFRQGQPFTYIDFDTLMRGSIWIDIGDLLRSLSCDKSQTEVRYSKSRISDIIRGYHNESNCGIGISEFIKKSMIATQTIALELAMRSLIDIVDDRYFGWDSSIFKKRQENNLARARAQWELYMTCKDSM